ncbi:MAG: hypothetical protein AB8B86_16905 [Pseudomonadales bacterium]
MKFKRRELGLGGLAVLGGVALNQSSAASSISNVSTCIKRNSSQLSANNWSEWKQFEVGVVAEFKVYGQYLTVSCKPGVQDGGQDWREVAHVSLTIGISGEQDYLFGGSVDDSGSVLLINTKSWRIDDQINRNIVSIGPFNRGERMGNVSVQPFSGFRLKAKAFAKGDLVQFDFLNGGENQIPGYRLRQYQARTDTDLQRYKKAK